jgi:hypothetical protein
VLSKGRCATPSAGAYTNESLPEAVRLQAAAYALPYERAKPVTADGRSVEQIREEVRQEFLRDGEDYKERLMEEIERHAAIHRQEREEVLRRSMDEDTWIRARCRSSCRQCERLSLKPASQGRRSSKPGLNLRQRNQASTCARGTKWQKWPFGRAHAEPELVHQPHDSRPSATGSPTVVGAVSTSHPALVTAFV